MSFRAATAPNTLHAGFCVDTRLQLLWVNISRSTTAGSCCKPTFKFSFFLVSFDCLIVTSNSLIQIYMYHTVNCKMTPFSAELHCVSSTSLWDTWNPIPCQTCFSARSYFRCFLIPADASSSVSSFSFLVRFSYISHIPDRVPSHLHYSPLFSWPFPVQFICLCLCTAANQKLYVNTDFKLRISFMDSLFI